MKRKALVVLMVMAATLSARAQDNSSSLYLAQPVQLTDTDGRIHNPYMQAASYAAVLAPEPRKWNVHDLVTIIVRESSTAVAEGELSTQKDVEVSGNVESFVDLSQLLTELRVQPAPFKSGKPAVGVQFGKEFEGDGDYERKDEVVTRLTAQVIDVKPNGVLAVEVRTHLANDQETMTITVTGYCRAEDVTADNTVLSTQMFDLRVSKTHTGEIRDASKKGVLTKALDFLFNF